MKKIKIFLLLLIITPATMFSQIVGIGVQYADAKGKGNDAQFAANVAVPIWTKKNPLNMFLSSGVDYTGGSSPISGINFKPIQLTSYLSESFFNRSKITCLVGADAGYLLNHRHGKDGIVLTPYVHLEYSILYLKSGWDFNVTNNRNQFFLRIGIGFGIGTMKSMAETKIR